MSIAEYNSKFGTSLEENEEYEMYFKQHYEKARKAVGPDEFITVKFYDMAERKSWSKWIGDKAKGMYKWGKDKVVGKKPKKDVKKVVEEQVDLDDILSDEEEAEEAVAEVEEKQEVEQQVSEGEKIKEIVAEAASDAQALAQDLKHLIQFKSSSVELRLSLIHI